LSSKHKQLSNEFLIFLFTSTKTLIGGNLNAMVDHLFGVETRKLRSWRSIKFTKKKKKIEKPNSI